MKTITVQVPDDFQFPDNYEIKVVEKPKFKKGDIITTKTGFIAIYEKTIYKYNRPIVYFNTIYSSDRSVYNINKIDCGIGYEYDCDLANEHEKNILINALKSEVINKTKNADDARKVLKETFNITVDTIKTYKDLIDNKITINCGYWINPDSEITKTIEKYTIDKKDKNIAKSEKVAKSMLAMAQISMLMPFYGGEITDEEWKNVYSNKFTIERDGSESKQIKCSVHQFIYYFLAFHTKEQRDEFLKYNEQLVKDYLMID